jgi:hypothetical protein
MSERDPVIDEVREVRHAISARFRHDPARLVAHYMKLQKQYRERLVLTDDAATVSDLIRQTRRSTRRAKSTGRRST